MLRISRFCHHVLTMKIYTKTGDKGETSLFGGTRVQKNHLRIHAYGTLDELNSFLGLAFASIHHKELRETLEAPVSRIQSALFEIGSELATPPQKTKKNLGIQTSHIEELEKLIDQWTAILPPLKSFILPGGTPESSHLHCCRTISRRAEREVISLHQVEPQNTLILEYLNRLSDLLFVAARLANHLQRVTDKPWNPLT